MPTSIEAMREVFKRYPEFRVDGYRMGGLCGPQTDFYCASLEGPMPKARSKTNRTLPVK